MKLLLLRRPQAARRQGFTVAELLIASSVGLLIGGVAGLLILESAREDVRSVADMAVEQAASDLEGRLVSCLRIMSARESVVYTTPTEDEEDGYRGFQRIIVAQGPVPDFPRAELRFDAATGSAIYLSNRLVVGSQEVLMQSHSNRVVLRNLCFFPSVKADSTPDNSLVNIVIEVDDDGSSRRRTNSNPARIQRTFAVKMRNN
jgi:hypothetical protein